MFDLNEFFLFNSLEISEKQVLISKLPKPTYFKKGEVIYSATHFPNAVGIIISGKAFAVTNNGNRLYMNSFSEGTCFGAAAIFGNNNEYVSTITAEVDIEILFLTEEILKKIFLEFPQTAINYIEFLSGKIRFLNKKVGLLSSGSAESTMLNYLTTIADNCGNATLPRNMTLLSKTLGISRASLYRCLEALENEGLILKNKNTVKVIKNEKNS